MTELAQPEDKKKRKGVARVFCRYPDGLCREEKKRAAQR